jgi:hypothetical protein
MGIPSGTFCSKITIDQAAKKAEILREVDFGL